jgi:MoaA/NifB/PqqE/SkfB family radical SAM enzyme
MNNAFITRVKHAVRKSRLRKPYLQLKYLLTPVREFPSRLDIELTNICNLRCIMCPREHMTRNMGYMDPGLFSAIFDEAGRCDLKTAWLFLYGEPLLHPEVIPMLRIAREKAPKCDLGLSTNSTIMDDEIIEGLLTSGIDKIILSFDGVTKETFEKIRPPAKFDDVMRNTMQLLMARKKTNGSTPRILLQIIRMEETLSEIEAFRNYWKPYLRDGDEVVVKNFDTFAGTCQDKLAPSATGSRRSSPCPKLWDSLTVLWDGRVPICCYDYDGTKVLGNAAGGTLKEIWKDKAIQDFRRMHRALMFPDDFICTTCPYMDE